MLRFFIGFDQVETEAWHVLTNSILRRASVPVSFMPVKKSLLPLFHSRPKDARQSNEFSFSRFLTPYLAMYEGWAVFCDCDMMFRADAAELLKYMDAELAVVCCQHDYVPRSERKYLGNVQYSYPRKNWSSFMLLNCSHPQTRALTPSYVNSASGANLHRLQWADDDCIGSLPLEWNWLVGEYDHNPDAKNVHWTLGGPWNAAYAQADYAEEWFAERAWARHALSDGEVVL